MSEIIKRKKALSVMPLKSSAPLGATLAFLGLNRSIPMLHGSQGCTAFAKVMCVRHFREPIPLQTTAMDQIATVMGADDNVIEGLRVLSEKSAPAVIGLVTTGLSETQGADIRRSVNEFRQTHPEFADTAVVPVNAPDYVGGLESGYARAVEAMIETLVSTGEPGRRRRQINVLVGPGLNPGDQEALKELIEAFELRPVLLPELGDSLDGHLDESDFSPLTIGGTAVEEIAHLGDALATLVVGPSMAKAGELLHVRTGVPELRLDHLLGQENNDRLVSWLAELSAREVPPRIERRRYQLQDAMVDSHFMLGQRRVALAAEPDDLLALSEFLQGMGAEVVAAVTPSRGPALEKLLLEQVKIGDLEDLEKMAAEADAELLIGNSHLAQIAGRLDIPLLRYGFPQFDRLGGFRRQHIGYDGGRELLFELGNLILAEQHKHEITPHRSIFRGEESADGRTETAARVSH